MSHAFRDATAIETIQGGYFRRIAVTVVKWASADSQIVNMSWILIDRSETSHPVAAALGIMRRNIKTGVISISRAFLFAANLFPKNGFAVGIRSSTYRVTGATTRVGGSLGV